MPAESIVTLLTEDHQEAERSLKTFADADRSRWGDMFSELAGTLVRHEVAEEIVVYPVVRQEPGGAPIADARVAEQSQAADLLSNMEMMDPTSDEFAEAFDTLREAVLEHASSEESEVFPLLEQHEDEAQLAEMGERYTEVKSLDLDGRSHTVNGLTESLRSAAKSA